MNTNSRKIIIIGSKGFVGSHVSLHFEGMGHSVWGADVVIDYEKSNRYFLIDASNSDYREIFEMQKFDVCINCSGAASVPDSIIHPLRDFNLNTVNVFKLLDAIRIYCPQCRFINLSSAAVYGNPNQLPVTEILPTLPVSPYGVHKVLSEKICSEFHQFFKIHTCSLRIFSAYGEGLKKQLFWDLYQKKLKGGAIHLYGSGAESRDFIHVVDLAFAIQLVSENASFAGEVINVANGEEVTIRECVENFYGLFPVKPEYFFTGQEREGDPVNWKADISVLLGLGYKKKITLKDGLARYYEWCTKQT
ncbi:MAG: NAD-dependent epimerase/dehydratase family protein [Cyclobacteriaceae bacterium]|nr:NAD-dependent epimerase/dehydratase family protein [Cyclobacteriaceae bacterium]